MDDKQYGIFSFLFFIDEVDHIILLNKLRAMGLLTGLINILLVELKLLSLMVFNALLETNTKEYHSVVHHLHKKSTNNIVIFIFAQIMPSGVFLIPMYGHQADLSKPCSYKLKLILACFLETFGCCLPDKHHILHNTDTPLPSDTQEL